VIEVRSCLKSRQKSSSSAPNFLWGGSQILDLVGEAENAGLENAGLENPGPNDGWKTQDWKMQDHLAGGGKCGTGKRGTDKVWKA